MTTLSDFFKKETVRSAPSGKEAASPRAHKFRRGVMTALLFASSVAAPSLSQAFAQQQPRKIVIRQPIENVTCKTPQGETLTYRIYNGYQDSTHVARIREAVDAAMKTPTGASVLKPFMQKKGIISMRHGMGNTLGSYMASNNEIRLNAEARGSSLKSTIVHEGTHAKQKAAGYSLERDMNAASIFRVGRALEADACTHQRNGGTGRFRCVEGCGAFKAPDGGSFRPSAERRKGQCRDRPGNNVVVLPGIGLHGCL